MQRAIELVFRKFAELGTVRQTLLCFLEHGLEVPACTPRGYSRDHRPDWKQVNIVMVVSRGGLPLGDEVFAGNRSDVTTVEEIITTMEEKYGRANRIWVMDRGMVSEDNVELLKRGGRRYILGTPAACCASSNNSCWRRTGARFMPVWR